MQSGKDRDDYSKLIELNHAFSAPSNELVLAVITAYPLSRMRFRGRGVWFWVILSSMMIPGVIFLVPHYIMMIDFNWIDTYHALIWPGLPAAFGVFLMRQFFISIPREVEEAARLVKRKLPKALLETLEKSTHLLPLIKPVLFIFHW